jgi:hypothetical protein
LPQGSTGLRDQILSVFERTRQSPGAPFEPDRLLAFLTDPPAPKGRRVRDTFAGRRRFVRFMNTIQRDAGICFTIDEWERGFGLDDLTSLVAKKAGRPEQGLRLARQRVEEARRRQVADPLKFGLLTFPLLVVAALTDSWAVRTALLFAWAAVVCGVAAVCRADLGYSQELVSHMSARAGLGRTGSS